MARILHLIASNHRRGAETFAVELADHLRGVGHDVRVMAVEESGVDAPLPVEVAGRRRFGSRRLVQAAGWSDVVVSFGSTSLIVGAAAARLVRRPFVYRNIGDPSVWGAARFADLRIGLPVRSARRVVALYPGAADTLRSAYQLDPERIRVIPRGVPDRLFTPADDARRATACAELELDPGRRWVAYVGALSPEKDPLLAVDALAELPEDVGLVIAGGGPLENEVTSRCEPYGARARILGVCNSVATVYDAADALVLPSRTEGIPGAAIEAGLSGLPVATFDVGGTSSVVLDRRTGRVIDERTPRALAAAIDDVLLHRDELGAAARRHCAEDFSMRSVGAAWESVLAEVTDDRDTATRGSVLQVTSTNARRGAEVSAQNISDGLRSLGYRVRHVALEEAPAPNRMQLRVLGAGRFRPATIWRLTAEMRSHDVTIVHGGTGLWPTLLASALARRPYVYRGIGEPSYWGSVRLGQVRIGIPVRRAAVAVALYRSAAADLADRYRLEPGSVAVIPNVVPAGEFPAVDARRRAEARRQLEIGDDQLVVGSLGALSPEKRPEWVIETAGRIQGIVALVGGTGPLADELDGLAARVAPTRARLVGPVENASSLYASVDLVLLPSRTEGMPASVIEAALSGVPVVATDVGGVREIVEELHAGWVVDGDGLDDFVVAVRSALDDLGRFRPDRELAIQRHDVPRVAAAWDELLSGVLAPVGARQRPSGRSPTSAERPARS